MTHDLNRGLYTDVVDIRRKVFAHVAKTILNYSDAGLSKIKEETAKIPFKIINREDPVYRCCVYKERAIVAERVRLALGLPLWEGGLSGPVYIGIEKVLKPERIPELFLVKVIAEACEKCPTRAYEVTNNCRLCIAHPCSLVCPVKAISFNDTQAVIDQAKCIKCGRCQQACPYQAIVNYDRPCAAACGVDAIESDEHGRARIHNGKCVRCGMCIVACPFGAIADKSEFAQMLLALKKKQKLYAMIAPSIVGQFGPHASPEEIATALVKMGFAGVAEVAYGADVATLHESKEWIHKVMDEGQPFLGTSCCPAWADMARGYFPQIADRISASYTPMTATGKWIKDQDPDARVVFIGPCVAKKAESLRPEVAPYVDFVITYEELASIFVAMEIDLADITEKPRWFTLQAQAVIMPSAAEWRGR
jgi:[FeFe] hydrogenase (group B1/B3)